MASKTVKVTTLVNGVPHTTTVPRTNTTSSSKSSSGKSNGSSSGEPGVSLSSAQYDAKGNLIGSTGTQKFGYSDPTYFTQGGSSSTAGSAPELVFPGTKRAVLTSTAAQKYVDDKINPAYEAAKAGLESQQANLAEQARQQKEAAVQQQEADLTSKERQQKIAESQTKTKLLEKEANAGEVTENADFGNGERAITYKNGTTEIYKPVKNADGSVSYDLDRNQTDLYQARQQLQKANTEYAKQAENVSKQIEKINRGAVPLTSAESAQVAGLQQQFQNLITQQTQVNQSASGTAMLRGYQSGAAEYDPTFNVKTIGSIVSAGNQKIADLNVQMASAVAELEDKFRRNKISGLKDSFDLYESPMLPVRRR